MTVHDTRQVRRALQRNMQTGTPLRVALGAVQSTTTGTAQVTLDGGTTAIPAFIPTGLSLPAGACVLVILAGTQAFIVNRYS